MPDITTPNTTDGASSVGAVVYSGTKDAPMTEAEAREFVNYVHRTGTDFVRRVLDAYNRTAHLALGYGSWQEMCEAEGFASLARLPRDKRSGVVVELHQAGMSQRAISSAVGVDQATVSRDLDRSRDAFASPDDDATVGLDGKKYTKQYRAGGVRAYGRSEDRKRLSLAARKIGQAAMQLETADGRFDDLRDALRDIEAKVRVRDD